LPELWSIHVNEKLTERELLFIKLLRQLSEQQLQDVLRVMRAFAQTTL